MEVFERPPTTYMLLPMTPVNGPWRAVGMDAPAAQEFGVKAWARVESANRNSTAAANILLGMARRASFTLWIGSSDRAWMHLPPRNSGLRPGHGSRAPTGIVLRRQTFYWAWRGERPSRSGLDHQIGHGCTCRPGIRG